jgi:hypothetical protein
MWESDSPFANDVMRQTLLPRGHGRYVLLDSWSDDAEVVAATLNHRPQMRFRLTYDGILRSTSNNPRPNEKWDIRKQLHPQLAELWQVHPALQGYQMGYAAGAFGGLIADSTVPADLPFTVDANRMRLTSYRATVGGHPQGFLPLVRSELMLTCSLDILFLRKDSPGSVVNAGDLDNRITTLFDGLRMPRDKNEMPSAGGLDADPFYCLLEDDSLVTSLTVRTDRLLSRPDSNKHEVRLILDVVVSPTRVKIEINSGFVGD